MQPDAMNAAVWASFMEGGPEPREGGLMLSALPSAPVDSRGSEGGQIAVLVRDLFGRIAVVASRSSRHGGHRQAAAGAAHWIENSPTTRDQRECATR